MKKILVLLLLLLFCSCGSDDGDSSNCQVFYNVCIRTFTSYYIPVCVEHAVDIIPEPSKEVFERMNDDLRYAMTKDAGVSLCSSARCDGLMTSPVTRNIGFDCNKYK